MVDLLVDVCWSAGYVSVASVGDDVDVVVVFRSGASLVCVFSAVGEWVVEEGWGHVSVVVVFP